MRLKEVSEYQATINNLRIKYSSATSGMSYVYVFGYFKGYTPMSMIIPGYNAEQEDIDEVFGSPLSGKLPNIIDDILVSGLIYCASPEPILNPDWTHIGTYQKNTSVCAEHGPMLQITDSGAHYFVHLGIIKKLATNNDQDY